MINTCIFYIIICKFRFKEKPSLNVSFLINKSLKISLYTTILLFDIGINLFKKKDVDIFYFIFIG